VHWLWLQGVVRELCDVVVLPGVRRPMPLGFKTDEIHDRQIAIELESDEAKRCALQSFLQQADSICDSRIVWRQSAIGSSKSVISGFAIGRSGHVADFSQRWSCWNRAAY
jgi:hypothetical protein